MNNWPWTWEDSECTDYLHPNAPHIEILQGRLNWSPRRVLILGCGDGTSMNGMARRNPNVQFYGVDMNARHIQKAIANSPANAKYIEAMFHEISDADLDDEKVDTVLFTGTAGYIGQDALNAGLVAAAAFCADDMRLIFNFPHTMVWKQFTIYRDSIAHLGRDKQAALKVVRAISAFHPSDAVRVYGETLLVSDSEQRHMLFAPHFEPMYDWEAQELLDTYGFSLIESRTSALSLEATSADFISSDFRWQVYGRKQV